MFTKTIVTIVSYNCRPTEDVKNHDNSVNEFVKKLLHDGLDFKVKNAESSNKSYLFLVTTIQYSPSNGIIE